ncbi:hypothetical protein SCHPADRAFT_914700 [Schizopora paradoxa]|uniref:3-hydroxyacyl-CoA dehydrogenase n=1 Tax=Schizopora paradoxa TaxID=27342 RepID=A0A0H2SCV9_9AGAM|nr:hypothetical protein SCHPADRAFT_914700 [Schizopora paradoxa]
MVHALANTSSGSVGVSAGSSAATASRRLASTLSHLSSGNDGAAMAKATPIERITIFGGGLMGAGIAQSAAQYGFKVTLCDVSSKALDNARDIISRSIARVAKRAYPDPHSSSAPEHERKRVEDQRRVLVEGVWGRIKLTTDTEGAVRGSSGAESTDLHSEPTQLVIEAIVEDLQIKRALFQRVDEFAVDGCIFATNTSSLSVADIAEGVRESRRARFGGLHFFNRTPQMKLVEVIRTDQTSEETFQALLDVCARMKKKAVKCKDTPGFIVNRLLVPYMAEADIDIAMKLGAAMGPIELTDFVGLDTTKHILDGWREKLKAAQSSVENTETQKTANLPAALVEPSPMLEKLVKEGKLGHKTGEGFLKHRK